MSIVSIGELIARAAQFEDKLEHYYADLRDTTDNPGVKLLTYYLSRHRRHLEEAKSGFQNSTFDQISHVELKHDSGFHPEKDFHIIAKPLKDITGEELLKAAAAYDEQLIHLYEAILSQPIGKDAEVFIQSLLSMEKRDIVMLKKMLAMDYF